MHGNAIAPAQAPGGRPRAAAAAAAWACRLLGRGMDLIAEPTAASARGPQRRADPTAARPPTPAARRAAAPPRPRTSPPPTVSRAYNCRCGRPVFFGNSRCLACDTPLGYEPDSAKLLALVADPPVADGEDAAADDGPATTAPSSTVVAADVAPAAAEAAGDAAATAAAVDATNGATEADGAPLWWRAVDGDDHRRYQRCTNFTAAACNWLVGEDDAEAAGLCRSCRLTRTLPDLSIEPHTLWWTRFEVAKRRLVSSLIGLRLPIASKTEDPERGLVFDLLRAPPEGPGVVTGHEDGVITIDVEEADDAWREQRRTALAEPYRTLLGHLRHETGHYYWQRLVDGTPWLDVFRAEFGDERADYGDALKQHYADGAPADWGQRHVSAYASSHPWEDWAETWAHYLHLIDTLDTARSFGLDGERVELNYERFDRDALAGLDPAHAERFLQLVNNWMELTGVLNELSRSMGVHDFYPFVLSAPALRKLYVVHCVVAAAGAAHPRTGAPQ